MAQRLFDNLTSDYLAAAARLAPHGSRRKVVVYVESYDDIFFWRSLLDEVEAPGLRFEVMLPSQSTLGKGKKVALMNALSHVWMLIMIIFFKAPLKYHACSVIIPGCFIPMCMP